MGPERNAPENFIRDRFSFELAKLQWGRSGMLRKTRFTRRLNMTRSRLQWGRSGMLRKTDVVGRYAKGANGSDWILRIAGTPSAGELADMTYYCFALRIDPGADFTFEVDHIKIVEK